jgi:hypothetical protein
MMAAISASAAIFAQGLPLLACGTRISALVSCLFFRRTHHIMLFYQ